MGDGPGLGWWRRRDPLCCWAGLSETTVEPWWLLILVVGYGAWAYWRVWSNRRNVLAEMASVEQDMSAHEGLTAPVQQSLSYVIHHNHFVGRCLRSVDMCRKSYSAFDVFEVKLHSVGEIFRGAPAVTWDRSYAGAQMVYAQSGEEGHVPGAHGTVLAMHTALYRKAGIQRVTTGTVGSAAEFIALIRAGRFRGKRTRFTYVILPDGSWRFSPMDEGTRVEARLLDRVSKHSVHANAEPDLTYGGVFQFDPETLTLIVDNDSGAHTQAAAHRQARSPLNALREQEPSSHRQPSCPKSRRSSRRTYQASA